MASFWQLMEHMASDDSPTDDSIEAVRTGINIRPNFWEDFIRLTGNASDLSILLDVPGEKIAGWASKINKILDQIQQMDDGTPSSRSKTLPTGEK
jgi:hypothetical protein